MTVNGSGATVYADREALSRALWNLLDNAAKYSPGCKTVWLDVESAGGTVSIRVRDRGVGIPRREQQEIFEKFVRGRAPDGASVRGTGMGLAMVRQIAVAHGGDIEVDSEPGHGSTFTLSLPSGE